VTKESAGAAKILADLGLHATITADKTVVRLGAVHVTATPAIASAGEAAASP